MGRKRIKNRCPIRKAAIIKDSYACKICRHNKNGVCLDTDKKLYKKSMYMEEV